MNDSCQTSCIGQCQVTPQILGGHLTRLAREDDDPDFAWTCWWESAWECGFLGWDGWDWLSCPSVIFREGIARKRVAGAGGLLWCWFFVGFADVRRLSLPFFADGFMLGIRVLLLASSNPPLFAVSSRVAALSKVFYDLDVGFILIVLGVDDGLAVRGYGQSNIDFLLHGPNWQNLMGAEVKEYNCIVRVGF